MARGSGYNVNCNAVGVNVPPPVTSVTALHRATSMGSCVAQCLSRLSMYVNVGTVMGNCQVLRYRLQGAGETPGHQEQFITTPHQSGSRWARSPHRLSFTPVTTGHHPLNGVKVIGSMGKVAEHIRVFEGLEYQQQQGKGSVKNTTRL